ncbi:MAG: inositol monophosphatase family protein [Campylobacteraceae bacterium]
MDFLKEVIKANKEIYSLIKSASHEDLCKSFQAGFGGDLSVFIDLEAEKIFVKNLKTFGEIFSEESGEIGEGEDLIIIDPIDGSDNFKSNIPYFGTSVAKISKGITTHAIVTNLVNGDVFYKINDEIQKTSLFFNNTKPLHVNKFASVGIFERAYDAPKMVQKLKNENIKYRSSGALALSLAIANEVSFVLFEGKIREFDIAAGYEICNSLYRFKDDRFILVSQDKKIFDKIRLLIEQKGNK